MNLYNNKKLALLLVFLVVVVGFLTALWGYAYFLGSDQISCSATARSGASCGTKFGFILVVVFIFEALGLTYIRSKYLGY